MTHRCIVVGVDPNKAGMATVIFARFDGSKMVANRSHRWLSGPPGSAFLYARPEVQHLVEPLVVSWGWEPERTNLLNLDGAASRFVLENEWQGTREPAA